MPGFKDLLIEKGPQIAMMLLAAKQGGPQAVTGLMEGLQASQMRRQRQEDQAQQRMRQQTLDQQAQEDRAFRRSDIDADNARADMQFKQQQFEHALALMDQAAQMQGESAMDPAQVEAALQQQATGIGEQYSVPSEQLMQFAPPAAPLIAKGIKADIAALLESAAAESKRRGQPYDDTTITFAWSKLKPRLQQALVAAGHPEGQDVKPSTLDQMRGLAVRQAPPVTKPPTPGSFEDYLAAPPERRAAIEAARKGYAQADDPAQRPPDPVAQELAKLRLEEARSRQITTEMPAEYRVALNRAIMSIPTVRRGSVVQTANQLWQTGQIDELQGVIRQAAIESEPVDMKNQIMGRQTTMALVKDVKDRLEDLRRRGVPTNWFVGTVEDLARRLGTSTNPEYASLSNELMGTLINYRRAATGVQFSQRESKDYQRMFPNYKNTLPVNLALLDGLIRQMEVHDRTYWTHKLGAGAAFMGAGAVPKADTNIVEPESDPLGLFP